MNKIKKLDALKKKYVLIYLYFMCSIYLFFTVSFWPVFEAPFTVIAIIVIAMQLLSIFYCPKIPYSYIASLSPIYILINTILVSPFIIVIGAMPEPNLLIYVWYIIIPAQIYFLYQGKKAIYWNIYVFLLITFCYFSADIIHWLNIDISNVYKEENASKLFISFKIINYAGIGLCFLLVCYCEYCKEKLHQASLLLNDPISKNDPNGSNDLNVKKYIELYDSILEYFEKEKPYIDPDFSIVQLTLKLDTNVSYISKAIKIRRDMNYIFFVNTFRIQHVKDMITQNSLNKYTLEYIYLSSGFKNQSTFNKVFKQIEGVTPSEYYKNINQKNTVNK
jgi:AraC-like DNA-binding protein